MKRRSIFTACGTLALVFIMIGIAAIYSRNSERARNSAFRTIDDNFAIHKNQGWTLTSAPTDGRRCRIIGATQSSGPSLRGSFTASNRSVDFDIEVPTGRILAIEGLEPVDGDPRTYAVLARDLPD